MQENKFIETLKLLDGHIFHIEYHQERLRNTFSHFFSDEKVFSLETILSETILPTKGKYKIRFVYDASSYFLEILPYQTAAIHSISCVEVGDMTYSYKFLDREALNQLKKEAPTDEVIFIKEGMVTDSSYANLVFSDGGKWYTPTTFLLNGTCRQRLLKEGKIEERPIFQEDITSFRYIGLINAMLDLGELILPLDHYTSPSETTTEGC